MNLEHAERKRDLRLRRRLLMVLHAARSRGGEGWLNGRMLVDLVDGALPGGQCFDDDAHATALLHDLVAGAYVDRRDDRAKTYQPASLDLTSYRVTHKGTALAEQQIEPDPLVEDDRVRRGDR